MRGSASQLEEVVAVMSARPARPARIPDVRWERQFAGLLEMLRPRIAHLIRSYGLADMREDAEQVCAIAVLRALETYEPRKAQFATHVTWQMRGELQGLRHRMRLDQRQSARSAGVRTVSMEALTQRAADDATIFEIVDETALSRSERVVSDHMAGELLRALLDRLGAPGHERAIVTQRIFADDPPAAPDRKTREQHRQIMRRVFRNCAKLLAS